MQSNSKTANEYSLHSVGLRFLLWGASNDGVNYAAFNDGVTDA